MGNTVNAALGTLAVGSSASITIQTQVNVGVGINVVNTATVSTASIETNTTKNSRTLIVTLDAKKTSGRLTSQ